MKAFFVVLVLAAAALAEDVKEQQVKVAPEAEAKAEAKVEAKAEQAGDDQELDSRFGGVFYARAQPQPVYYWPYAAPSQLARTTTTGAVAAYPYSPYYRYAYEYPYYNYYNYYTYPYSAYYTVEPVVAAAPAPKLVPPGAPSVGSTPYGNY